MPNVMGREFPYTAEGMAAAQQYSQAMGMRDGGSMGFRPVGYAGGGVATPQPGGGVATPQPGGGTSMTGFMGTSSPLAQLFRDRYVAPSGDALVRTPETTGGPFISGADASGSSAGTMVLNDFRREFGRDPSGPPELQEYMLSRGRDGGSMGYAGGGPVGYADGDVVLDDQSRAAIIEKLMDMTGMGPNTFVPLTNGQLINAVQTVEAEDLAAKMQQMQQMAPMMEEQIQPTQPMPDPTGFPPEGGDQMLMSRPGMSSMRDNIGMAGGGIMSLRGY